MTAIVGTTPGQHPAHRARRGPLRRVLALSLLLGRLSRQGSSAVVLPVIAFAVTTALLLVVTGGTAMFFTTPNVNEDLRGMYGIFASLALMLLAVPTLTLGAAAARLSARRRNDRLATLRLMGASSAEVSAITVIEAVTTALLGAVGGVLLYAGLLPLVGLIHFFGKPIGAAALWAGPGTIAIVVAAVAVLAMLSAVMSLRTVRLTPLGVRKRTDAPPTRWWLLAAGLGALAVALVTVIGFMQFFQVLASLVGPIVLFGLLVGAFAVGMLVINLIGSPITAARGRSMAKRAKNVPVLIAGRELAADGAAAWRRVSGLAMVSFIAVIGGSGMSLFSMVETGEYGSVDDGTQWLAQDVMTGVLLTLAIAFVMLACSVGVTQAAAVLEDRELIVGLDKLGVPMADLARARRSTVLVPLRWAALGGALIGAVLALPVIGLSVVFAPLSVGIIVLTFAAGFTIVWLAMLAVRPLMESLRTR